MVKANELYRTIYETLTEAGIEDAGFEADVLIEHVAGKHRLLLEDLCGGDQDRLLALAKRRAAREPLQYLLGRWAFLDLELEVGPGVLIPRPETEEVCLQAVQCLEGKRSPVVLDLCAGSGALALGIQSLCPDAEIQAVEKYKPAFGFLKKNVCKYEDKWVRVPQAVLADVEHYHRELPANSVDLIVANPPYVSETEYPFLAPELSFEPKTALVAGEGGLYFYKLIAQRYKNTLKPGGTLLFELGENLGEKVQMLLLANQYNNLIIRKDTGGKPRILSGISL
ncbi:peptide chain release factor N(5)-glutamine methyltransferase [Ruminococcaceae bacterium OttesenSCG-928-I18]|nr:peptide chain release factor N(5)-glutamine methyltransferase [Ruminococcaceae bacterium OttesenSCG-928-I18]